MDATQQWLFSRTYLYRRVNEFNLAIEAAALAEESSTQSSEVLAGPSTIAGLKRELGFRDLALFYIVSSLSVRWIATAAASGPSSIVVWLFALFGFFIPLAASVLEMSSRYPQEGGLYVWSQRAFGDFSGFMAAWTYWMSNLPYFSAILYFAAGSALFVGGERGRALSEESNYFLGFALVALAVITLLNMIGVKQGKWLNNVGAIGTSLPVVVLLVLGFLFWRHQGSATHFTLTTMAPHLSLKNAIFWSTIFYAFAGVECASFMGGEIKNPRRTIPRAMLFAGIVVTIGYMLGTIAMLIALRSDRISGLGGFMTALAAMCQTLGVDWMTPVVALMVAVACLGGAGAYLSSTARLPFVAGIDNYLPAVFGRIHPRWKTPYVAVFSYGLTGMLFAIISQAATSVKGAYDALVSMSVITYFIPYVFLFLASLKLQREPIGPEVLRFPGGRWISATLACIGLFSTIVTIGLSIVPESDEPNKPLAILKTVGMTLVLVGAGVATYSWGKRRQRREALAAK
jgi:amino acid transporter